MSYYDFMLQNAETQKIIDAHKNDFNANTVKDYLAKHGGYKAYIRSLGGVFKKYVDFTGKITSKGQIAEICDYVWGLYQIWGVDYSNGCSATWDKNAYKTYAGKSSAFYPSASPSARYGVNYGTFGFANGEDLPGIDEQLGNPGKYYATTNCDQGVLQVFKKAGLVPSWYPGPAEYPAYYKSHGLNYKVITKMSDLQPGDVLLFSDGTIPRKSSYENWPSWFKHTSIVAEKTSSYIITFDSGHAYTHYGEPRTKRPLSGKPYEWCNDWIAFRYNFTANLTDVNNGWIQKNGKWYYYEAGKLIKGWKKILYQGVKRWFFLNDDGTMATGWKKIFWNGANRWFFFGSDGAMRTGWHEITYRGTKKWFFFDDNGVMLTGLHELSWKGKKAVYYFDPESGVMQTGKVKVKVKFDGSGKLAGGTRI